jgi:hypothetical protein
VIHDHFRYVLRNRFNRRSALALLAACNISTLAQSATVDPNDLARMAGEARKRGVVPVIVHLAPVSLDQMHADLRGVNAAMAERAARLTAELGSTALTAGRWDNGIGQIGLYVNESGLRYLQGSGNAISFASGPPWTVQAAVNGDDGRLGKIDDLLDREGFAAVVVTLNIPALEYDIAKDGRLSFPGGDNWAASAQAMAASLASVAGTGVIALPNFNAPRASLVPEMTLRVNREGLLNLLDTDLVRSIRPVGFRDARPFAIDTDVLTTAQRDGTADVIITMRDPLTRHRLSAQSRDAATQTRRRNLLAALAGAGVTSRLQDIAIFGAVAGRITLSELRSLQAANDARLLRVELNKPMANAHLATSTVTMNMAAAWNKGYRAAGQKIIIMDSGTLSTHPFLLNAAGKSRVTLEACFGSNGGYGYYADGTRYELKSVCPLQGQQGAGDGDSPVGLAGSAQPVLNCSSYSPWTCDHGTHVAGIAAGRASSAMPIGMQGVAPDADIVAVQVFSYDPARIAAPQAFTEDLLKALQAVAGAITPGSTGNPLVVNMSLGAGKYASSCAAVNSALSDAVQTLFDAGVAVVVSTGNGQFYPYTGYNDGIAWPACVPRVIKVSAVNNDGIGNTRATYAHLADPSHFPGDSFWMAPGGGGGTYVNSSVIDGTAGKAGTSQAAPHIAGLYAAVKAAVPGISVNGVSDWIRYNASIPLSVQLSSTTTVQFNRVRLPNL